MRKLMLIATMLVGLSAHSQKEIAYTSGFTGVSSLEIINFKDGTDSIVIKSSPEKVIRDLIRLWEQTQTESESHLRCAELATLWGNTVPTQFKHNAEWLRFKLQAVSVGFKSTTKSK